MAPVERDSAGVIPRRVGVLAALPMELGPFRATGQRRRVHGVSLSEHRVEGFDGEVSVALSGVGKVAAAHAASVLLQSGIDALLVVGTCGGLRVGTALGSLVHADLAIQWDLAVRSGHRLEGDRELSERWRAVAPGLRGPFLTADRPAIRVFERARRARGVSRDLDRAQRPIGQGPGHPVADMETAAAAAVAASGRVPWAALRVVSDERLGLGALLRPRKRRDASFSANAPALAHLPASTVPDLLRSLIAR